MTAPRAELEQRGIFHRVMVGLDGREGGRDSVALARRLAAPGASFTLVHVRRGRGGGNHGFVPGQTGERSEDAEARLSRELELDAELVAVASSSPARGLHQLAEARHTDLLVLGSCHRGAFGRAVLGDDTSAGLDGAPCAVAVAPRGYGVAPKPLARIGVGYDGSKESANALAAARALAHHSGAAVRALRVVSGPNYIYTGILPPAGESVDALLRAAEADLRALAGVEAEAIYGVPNEDLASFSKAVDLLVVGSRGYGPARRLIEGSTSRYLLAHSRAPLLVLPRGALTVAADEATEPTGAVSAA